MTWRTSLVAISTVSLILAGCAGEDPPGEPEPTGDDAGDQDSADAPDPAANDDADEAEDEAAAEGPAGTVTLDGQTVDLDEAFWCEDFESAAGVTEMRIVGVAHDTIKLDAGAYRTEDGDAIDAVTIWQVEELDRGLGGTHVVAVEEGQDGHPWIDVDGYDVTIDGSYLGEDDPDGAEPAVFSAELSVEDEPRGDAFC